MAHWSDLDRASSSLELKVGHGVHGVRGLLLLALANDIWKADLKCERGVRTFHLTLDHPVVPEFPPPFPLQVYPAPIFPPPPSHPVSSKFFFGGQLTG